MIVSHLQFVLQKPKSVLKLSTIIYFCTRLHHFQFEKLSGTRSYLLIHCTIPFALSSQSSTMRRYTQIYQTTLHLKSLALVIEMFLIGIWLAFAGSNDFTKIILRPTYASRVNRPYRLDLFSINSTTTQQIGKDYSFVFHMKHSVFLINNLSGPS